MISIVLPTRKRHTALTDMVESALSTADDTTQVEFCIYVDEDDTETKECVGVMSYKGISIKHTTSPTSLNLSQMWNYAYEHIATGDIIMLCADDIRFRSKSWDTRVRQTIDKYEDKIVLVYGDDLIHGENLSTHPFVHRKWIETSGFWLPPYFVSDFVDLWLNDVSRDLGRRVFLPDVITEHLHHTVGKASIDETTTARLERHKQSNPQSIFARTLGERNAHFMRLLAIINK
jgi:glycosyltransferase involved in cell wall biosynthesis